VRCREGSCAFFLLTTTTMSLGCKCPGVRRVTTPAHTPSSTERRGGGRHDRLPCSERRRCPSRRSTRRTSSRRTSIMGTCAASRNRVFASALLLFVLFSSCAVLSVSAVGGLDWRRSGHTSPSSDAVSGPRRPTATRMPTLHTIPTGWGLLRCLV
jgi:hypothetical protein